MRMGGKQGLASLGGLAVLVLLGFTAAAAFPRGGGSHGPDVTAANEQTTTIIQATTQSTSITQTTTTTSTVQIGGKRRVVWNHPVLTLEFLPGWKFLFEDPRTHVLIRDEYSGDGVYFHALPRSVYDPGKNRGVVLHGDFLAWLQRHPFLRVGRIQQLRLGRFVATAIDGRVKHTDPDARDEGFCGESMSQGPCVPITVDQNAEGFVSFQLGPGEIFRIVKVKTPSRSVVIEIATFGKAQPFIPAAMRLLRTLRSG